jgi:3-dehydroquinate synthase
VVEIVVPVRLGPRSYEVHVDGGLLDRLGAATASVLPGRTALLVTDDQVGPLYAERAKASLQSAGFSVGVEVLPAGEATKTLKYASRLFDRLVERKSDRQSCVVALGGGVMGDLAGFAAATYARGLPFVQVPTTLLAMVDASVGGKVAVDHPGGKNLIGAFHQPRLVLCDLDCLCSLSERQYRCGLAETVKHGLILDAEMFAWMEASSADIAGRKPDVVRRLVARNCEIKAGVVEQDEHETRGLRSALNYGHTFAHSFETAGDYEALLHGEAVAIGMACAARLAEKLGRIDESIGRRQNALLTALGLPTRIPANLARVDLVDIMRRDKKAAAGNLQFVLLSRLGQAELVRDVEAQLVEEVLAEMIEGVSC